MAFLARPVFAQEHAELHAQGFLLPATGRAPRGACCRRPGCRPGRARGGPRCRAWWPDRNSRSRCSGPRRSWRRSGSPPAVGMGMRRSRSPRNMNEPLSTATDGEGLVAVIPGDLVGQFVEPGEDGALVVEDAAEVGDHRPSRWPASRRRAQASFLPACGLRGEAAYPCHASAKGAGGVHAGSDHGGGRGDAPAAGWPVRSGHRAGRGDHRRAGATK